MARPLAPDERARLTAATDVFRIRPSERLSSERADSPPDAAVIALRRFEMTTHSLTPTWRRPVGTASSVTLLPFASGHPLGISLHVSY